MNIITLDKLSKRYRISQLGAKSLREELARLFGRSGNTGADEFFALREVSCEIEQGEAVGFIGPNGSGKSTVLKLLARIIYPTQGKLIVRGSVASLIEVGAGFHPELTGRENIYLYGSIMGMRQADVRAKFDRIVEFAELERFIDTPVKRYSSGMYVRLGFAVAAHINPHVLLVDEVLAVGDAADPTVLKLQKQRDLLVDKYTLEKVGELTDQQERWAIPALTLVAMFERTRVKNMADW